MKWQSNAQCALGFLDLLEGKALVGERWRDVKSAIPSYFEKEKPSKAC